MAFAVQNCTDDPFYNLALEEALCAHAARTGEPLLFLWQNRLCCVIGVNQNPWLECNTAEMDARGALLVRRKTGGGAVCHDKGNLNFSFCFPGRDFDLSAGNGIVLSALERLGISAEASGRNDIVVNGKKISGSAFRHSEGFSLHHGTLLVNSDLSLFPKLLTPDSKKLEAKGVRSVSSRVTNLSGIDPSVTVPLLRRELLSAFERRFGSAVTLSPGDFDVSQSAEHYASAEFRFGRTPHFTESLSFRLPTAGISLGLTVEKGTVTDCQVWTDSLDTGLPQKLTGAILGKPYSPELVRSALDGLT